MVTLGRLIDELSIVNLKMWKQEDIKREFVDDDKKVADATRRTNALNQQRNDLIEEIDCLIIDYINGDKIPYNSRVGSTKSYGK